MDVKGVLAPGDKVVKYRIVRKLGAGGMGEVYLAHDDYLDRPVAIKVLPLKRKADHLFQEHMKREAAAGARLEHPNIVKVIDGGITDAGIVYVVMEYLGKHHTLRQVMTSQGLPAYQLLRIGIQVADGLVACHRTAIVHRDLKPENLALMEDGRVKIIDFGLARIRTAIIRTTIKNLKDDRRLLTPPYAAPEQLGGRSDDITDKVDIWALGAILYEMAVGKQIWSSVTDQMPTPQEATYAMSMRDPAKLRDTTRDLPAGLADLVDQCLSRDPAKRPTAVEVARHLRRVFALVPAPTVTDEIPDESGPASGGASGEPNDTMKMPESPFQFTDDLGRADARELGSEIQRLRAAREASPVATTAPFSGANRPPTASRRRAPMALGFLTAAVVVALAASAWWITHRPTPAADPTFPLPSARPSATPPTESSPLVREVGPSLPVPSVSSSVASPRAIVSTSATMAGTQGVGPAQAAASASPPPTGLVGSPGAAPPGAGRFTP